jgi:hypothetical protein
MSLTRDQHAVQDAVIRREDLHEIAGLQAREAQALHPAERGEEHGQDDGRRHQQAEQDIQTNLHVVHFTRVTRA